MDKNNREYKPFGNQFRENISEDIQRHADKFNDPVVLGEMLHLLLEERENTNRLFKTLIEKLDRIERMLQEQGSAVGSEDGLLPEVDQRIIDHVKQKGHATAEDIKHKFGYRGTNAASARLNRLFAQGLLTKRQVGRKVYYTVI